MTRKNISKYIQENWDEKKTSVTEASKETEHGKPLVKSEKEVYNFDRVCKELFPEDSRPSSVDAVQIQGRLIELIEFKSGFGRIITKKSFKKELCECNKFDPPEFCQEYGNLLLKSSEKMKAELIDSLKLKAVESYILLEKHIFPHCEETENIKGFRINYVVVVDANGEDGIEDTLAGLVGKESDTNNTLNDIRQALKRFYSRKDVQGESYLYDFVEVLSAEDFKNRINLLKEQ